MIKNIAEKTTRFFIDKKIINSDDKEIYDYCFEIACVSFITHLTVIIIAFVFNIVVCSLIFLLTFSLFRRICGGYHARSYGRCTVISLLSFLIFVFFAKILRNYDYNFLFSVIGFGVLVLLSPVEDANKPITEKQYLLLRKIIKIITYVLIFLFVILKCIQLDFVFENKYFFSFCYGICLVAFSLVISKLERRKNNVKT